MLEHIKSHPRTYRHSPKRPSQKYEWTPLHNRLTKSARIGRIAENLVIFYLKQRGWLLLARNYETHRGEIDLIAQRFNEDIKGYPTIAFIEVKARSTSRGLPPEMNVTASKRQKITATMRQWIGKHHWIKAVYRCDIASVIVEPKKAPKIQYFPAAFCGREEFGW